MELAATETIGYYRARAADYDEGEERQAWWAQVSDAVASLARTDLGATVLELAAGTGFWTQQLADRDLAVTAVDAAPEALEVNRRRLASRPHRVEHVVADLFNWHPDRLWDSCVGGFWLCKIPDTLGARHLAWLAGAVKPGGAAWFVDKLAAVEESDEIETRSVGDGRRFRIIDHPRTPLALIDSFRSVGFDVDVRAIGTRFCVISGQRRE